jgi:cobalt-zinc-cadmium efflux system protein
MGLGHTHHHHDDHGHAQAHGLSRESAEAAGRLRERGLRLAIVLTFGFALVEAVGGWWAQSLALMADAAHMLTDSAALLLAWGAARLSQRPPGPQLSYGWRRAEVIAALINALLMLGIVAFLVPAAIERFQNPREVLGGSVMLIAFIGLLINLGVLRILHAADRGALNTRGALLHVLGDLLGSVAALTAGAVIWATGWNPIDPLLSLLIAGLILFSALRLVRDVLHVLMEAVPRGIELGAVRDRLLAVPGVTCMHDLHIWTLAGDRLLLSAHVGIARNEDWPVLLATLQRTLRDDFGIGHATLQPEPPEYRELACETCDALPLDDHAH